MKYFINFFHKSEWYAESITWPQPGNGSVGQVGTSYKFALHGAEGRCVDVTGVAFLHHVFQQTPGVAQTLNHAVHETLHRQNKHTIVTFTSVEK